jgi:hypothetical protein
MRKRDIRALRLAAQERRETGFDPAEQDDEHDECECAACSEDDGMALERAAYSEVRSNG